MVLGNSPVPLAAIDTSLCGMVMERAGDQVSIGVGAACLGNPINCGIAAGPHAGRGWRPVTRRRRDPHGRARTDGAGQPDQCVHRPDLRARTRASEVLEMSDGDDTVRTAVAGIPDTAVTSATASTRIASIPVLRSIRRMTCNAPWSPVGASASSASRWGSRRGHSLPDGCARRDHRPAHRPHAPGRWRSGRPRPLHSRRVEPEAAFLLGRPLSGVITAMEAAAAVAIAPALEIIDSRFADFRFSLPTVIADNASSAGFVVGSWAYATTRSVLAPWTTSAWCCRSTAHRWDSGRRRRSSVTRCDRWSPRLQCRPDRRRAGGRIGGARRRRNVGGPAVARRIRRPGGRTPRSRVVHHVEPLAR